MRAEPIVNGLEEEWGGSVQVVQVNIRDQASRSLIDRLDAQFTPTFVLFDAGGEEVWRSVGNINAAEVQGQVEALGEP
jgi:thiol-disulfide isomerase/thioredoxin